MFKERSIHSFGCEKMMISTRMSNVSLFLADDCHCLDSYPNISHCQKPLKHNREDINKLQGIKFNFKY